MRTNFYLMLLVFFSFSGCSPKNEIEACYEYLKKHGQLPKDYVISKFEQYDYVFLGEYHRNKQDVDFVISLIPDLYENGIRSIAYEFYEYEFQPVIDSLLTAKEWDEKMLYYNVKNVIWGYFEYLDLFKKVWEFNQTLNFDQEKFRLVMLGFDYNPCKNDPFEDFDPEEFMADIIEEEIISKGEKALIYCGIHHAFTRYRQPAYDFEKDTLYISNNERTGNIIHRKFPEKTITINLHSPWVSDKGWDKQRVKPVNGVIDSVMSMLNNIPMGFDTKSTIMGNLKATDTYYAFGYENFKLADFCDGYIFLLPYKEVKFVSVEPNYYNDYYLNKLKAFMKCVGWQDEQIQMITKEKAIELLTERPEVHYGDLMK